MLSKSHIFYFSISFLITFVVGFFVWSAFFDFPSPKFFTAAVLPASEELVAQETDSDQEGAPEQPDKNPSEEGYFDGPVTISPQAISVGDQLDDIQEKLDVIAQQVQEFIAERAIKNQPVEPVVEPVAPLAEPVQEVVQNIIYVPLPEAPSGSIGGGGGGSNPAPAPVTYSKILISEVQVLPVAQRFVELYNPNSADVDLTGWYLQRKDSNDTSWNSFVSSTNFEGKTIPANGYFLISRELTNSDILLGITLSANNSLAFKSPDREIVDQTTWTQIADNTSWCVDFQTCTPTPKAQNTIYVAPVAPAPDPTPDSEPIVDPTPPLPDNSATKLKIITAPQTIVVDSPSSVFTVESQNSSGQLADVSATTYVSLSSDSATGSFSSKSSSECGTDWTKTSITIAKNTAHKSFCYKDSAPGTYTITVSTTGLSSDSQTVIVSP